MITQEQLQRYFNDQCTPEEKEHIDRWLRDDTADHSLLRNMLEHQWDTETGPAGGEDLKEVLLNDLRRQLYPQQMTGAVVRRMHRRRRLWYGAASIAAIFLVGLLFWSKSSVNVATVAQWDTIVNNEVRKKQVTLPDSTRIWLAPGSQLVYSLVKDQPERAVHLKGQAFFDVAHDSSRPFVVHSGNIETKVLGTAFNIEAYEKEKEIRISLVRGRVAINDEHKPVAALLAGEMLTYTRTSGAVQKEKLKITDMGDWTGHRIVFNDVRIQDALERLAGQYHFTIRYDKRVQLGNKRFSTVFDHETPEQMIRNILFITDYHFRLKEKELFIIP
jgi:ferric-dicitrate binding protein FerR (iron transport regulator)